MILAVVETCRWKDNKRSTRLTNVYLLVLFYELKYPFFMHGMEYIKSIGYYVYQRLLYVPTDLKFTNSTFCPQSGLLYFVWIWEQTAIIYLYSINWLVFITET